jgi:hypothetical protein
VSIAGRSAPQPRRIERLDLERQDGVVAEVRAARGMEFERDRT